MPIDNEIWRKCVEFHGHECPGLAIGFKVCEAVRLKMGITFSMDEEVVCVTENDACCVDAIQFLAGCSVGKGNLVYRGRGKMAFSFFNRKSGDAIRIVLKNSFPLDNPDRAAVQEAVLQASPDELFDFKEPTYIVPERARRFNNLVCEQCGETAAEYMMRISEGKTICLDCNSEYTRGW
jgi:formylmethanofuran dehydrogenase subunit E